MNVKKTLLFEKDGRAVMKEVLMLRNVEALKPVLNNERWRILKTLNEKPMYASQLARELKMHEQKAYYHIKLLKNAGIIKVIDEIDVRGATAKLYAPVTSAFGVELDENGKTFYSALGNEREVSEFFKDFDEGGKFNGCFVVGAPDPHGQHKARARDGHYATHLAMRIGKFFDVGEFSVRLDIDLIAEKELKNNLIVIGGPVTNLVMMRVNKHLPVYFSDVKPWGLHSTITGNDYTGDHVGMICKIKNPWDESKTIIAIAGIRFIGTKAAIMAISETNGLLKKGESVRVVQGFDYDGDGKIDTIEVLE